MLSSIMISLEIGLGSIFEGNSTSHTWLVFLSLSQASLTRRMLWSFCHEVRCLLCLRFSLFLLLLLCQRTQPLSISLFSMVSASSSSPRSILGILQSSSSILPVFGRTKGCRPCSLWTSFHHTSWFYRWGNWRCASTWYLNLPIGVDITSRSWLSLSMGIWWYPDVKSMVAKKWALVSICRRSWFELSVGHTGLWMCWLSLLKSATILTADPSPFGTGKAFDAQLEGSRPHGTMCPVSRALFISFSYMVLKWYGVS